MLALRLAVAVALFLTLPAVARGAVRCDLVEILAQAGLAGVPAAGAPRTTDAPRDHDGKAQAAASHAATRVGLAETLAVALREIASPHGRLADGGPWDLIHRAQLEATGAEVSLAPLSDPALRIAPGPVTLQDAMALYPHDHTIGVVELTGAELKETLEHAARHLAAYTFEEDRPLVEPGVPGDHFDAAEGVTYEIDLTRPVGDRITHLALGGEPLSPERRLRVAVSSHRMSGGGGYQAIQRAPRLPCAPRPVRELVADYLRRMGTLDGDFTRNWSLLPDYAASPERALIDLLVRRQVLPRAEALRFYPEEPARRGDLAYWLARAMGWRERRLSGAFADVPDSLEPWLDGLVRRRVLGLWQERDRFEPFAVVPLSIALEWCERAARRAGYALSSRLGDPSFRRGLLTGIDFGQGPGRVGSFVFHDTLTRAQAIALVANLRYPTVRVLETTDFHGAMLPGRERRSGRPLGGSAVLAAWIARLRAENPEGTVLLDGGDLFQGTMISNLAFGRPVVEQMNALGYVAAALGNHEFDWSADTLERRVHEMRFAALGANLVRAQDGRRPGWVLADTVVVRRGVRVGIFGLCYRRTPSVTLARHVAHLRFLDDSATAAARVPELRRRGRAQVVLGLGHVPAHLDPGRRPAGDLARLARGVPGVDAWFGGHAHNRFAERVAGVPTMIAGSHGEVVAVCDLRVDPLAGRVVESRFRLETAYGDLVTPDSAMAARVARWNAAVQAVAAQPVGRNRARLTRTRGGESTVGNLVADAMREAVGAQIALQNSGGLRADLDEGLVTRSALYEIMPFDNTIVVMQLTAAEVRRALEEGLRGGRVTQVSGVRYVFDPGRPPMGRVTALLGPDGTSLDTTRTFRVAVNNFMATGGDDYVTLARARGAQETHLLLRDALEAYVRARSAGGGELEVKAEGRIRRVGAGAGTRD